MLAVAPWWAAGSDLLAAAVDLKIGFAGIANLWNPSLDESGRPAPLERTTKLVRHPLNFQR